MPQTKRQTQRVGAMVESRSLVIETKRDARSAMKAGSVVSAGVRYEKTNGAGVEAAAHMKPRFLPSKPRTMKILSGFLFAGLGSVRNEVEVALPAAKQIPKHSAGVGFANTSGWRSMRFQMQFMPSLVKRAARIVWLVASPSSFGITGRSTGLPSAAR